MKEASRRKGKLLVDSSQPNDLSSKTVTLSHWSGLIKEPIRIRCFSLRPRPSDVSLVENMWGNLKRKFMRYLCLVCEKLWVGRNTVDIHLPAGRQGSI